MARKDLDGGPEPTTPMQTTRPGAPVTIVVPCRNQAPVLPHLARTLRDLENALAANYRLQFVFVDDQSTDETRELLAKLFGPRPDCTVLGHSRPRGVGAAILTGIRAADSEIVCSLDWDGQFDPRQLAAMIPMLEDGVDVVAASPFLRPGRAQGVPAWRLAISRGMAMLYAAVLRQKLTTYTCSLRVYRRSALRDLEIHEEGLLGLVETLGRLDLRGARIVECPAVLDRRRIGRLRRGALETAAGHARLLARLALARLQPGHGIHRAHETG